MSRSARITSTLLGALLGLAWNASAAGIQPGTMVALQIPGQAPAGWLSASDVGGALYITTNTNPAGWEQWQYGDPSGATYLQSSHGLRLFSTAGDSAAQAPLYAGDPQAQFTVLPGAAPAPYAAAVVVTMASRTVPGGTVALAVNGPNLVWVPYVPGVTQVTNNPPKVAQQAPPQPEVWWVLPQPNDPSGRASLKTSPIPLVTTLTVTPNFGPVTILASTGPSTCTSKCAFAFPSNMVARVAESLPYPGWYPGWIVDNGGPSLTNEISLPMSSNHSVVANCAPATQPPVLLPPNPYLGLAVQQSNGVMAPGFTPPPGVPMNTNGGRRMELDASAVLDPATCSNSSLTFHWTISSPTITPGSSISDAGITGYRSPKLSFVSYALPDGTYSISLIALSGKTGLSTTITNTLTFQNSALTASVFAACQSQRTLGGQCTSAAALPTTETP